MFFFNEKESTFFHGKSMTGRGVFLFAARNARNGFISFVQVAIDQEVMDCLS